MRMLYNRCVAQFKPNRLQVTVHSFHLATSEKNLEKSDMARKIFHSLDAVMVFFNQPQNQEKPHVQELLQIYNSKIAEALYPKNLKEEKKYPLITLEGLDGSGKSTQAALLAEYLGAETYHTPPAVLDDLKRIFVKLDVVERTAFYTLANYMAAMEIADLLKKNIVVLDRYWHSTSAYAIAQEIKDHPEIYNLPEENDAIYEWPRDLLKPDIVVFIDVSEDIRRKRHALRNKTTTIQEIALNSDQEYRKNALKAYLFMKNPNVIRVDGDLPKEEVFEYVKNTIKPIVAKTN